MVSVVLPTRNPAFSRLRRTLAGLAAQTLGRDQWELLVIDNGSSPALRTTAIFSDALAGRIVAEPATGLTHARLRGLLEARGELVVFVDDDNVLAADYLAHVQTLFARLPRLGSAGGPIRPEFESEPPAWTREFSGLLALRDLGSSEKIAPGGADAPWPECAPVGAGLCVRRAAAQLYVEALATAPARKSLDRAGRSLASGGDNDFVFTLLHGGWDAGYFPELTLTHLIPASRLDPRYLARLNEGVQRTWVRVLALHAHCPWPPITRWSVPLRSARAWWRERVWRGPREFIRWRGRHGRFLGQADLPPP